MSALCQKRTLLPLDIWQLEAASRISSGRLIKKHSLMACCASSRPLLDGFFSRSAASFATLLLTALLRQHPFFGFTEPWAPKGGGSLEMQFAPSHGRSLRPRGVGAERSSYSCSSIYCLQPFRLKARSGWPLSLSKHIM